MSGTKCAKYILMVFNIIFWLAGAVLLGIGIWALADKNAAQLLHVAALGNSESLVKAAAITLCCIGAFIFLIGFLACCGAMKENVCMLNTYVVVVIILFLAQITAGILAVIYKDELLTGMSNAMNTTLQSQYGQDGYSTETEAWDFMQMEFKCCGVKTPVAEWSTSKWKETSGSNVVPDTCCVLVDDKAAVPAPLNRTLCNVAAVNGSTTDQYFYHKGCHTSMYDWAVDHAAILIGVAFGLAGLQIVMVALAISLTCEVRNKNVYA